jgi:hypothetical protein
LSNLIFVSRVYNTFRLAKNAKRKAQNQNSKLKIKGCFLNETKELAKILGSSILTLKGKNKF